MDINGYIDNGLLLKTGTVYHVTERGYRSLARYFSWWLVEQGDKTNVGYDSPPLDFELLELDGCAEDEIGKVANSRYGHKLYYWQRLRRVILGRLSPDELTVLGVRSKRNLHKLPDWCTGLLSMAIEDSTDLRNRVNPLADETWGRRTIK